MKLWTQWLQAVYALRPACRRARTFVWMVLVLMGMCCRADNAGVTSFVRVLNFGDQAYHRFLHLFHSTGLDLDLLTSSWGINWGQTPITPQLPLDRAVRPRWGPSAKRISTSSGWDGAVWPGIRRSCAGNLSLSRFSERPERGSVGAVGVST